MTLYEILTSTWIKDGKEVEIDTNGIYDEAKTLANEENLYLDTAIEICMKLRFMMGRVK